jgi:transcriptional regulator with XRE-family HTH domain
MSQRQLADAISLTFQQVQKYENGTNRIDAARLAALSAALNVPPQWFLTDLGDGEEENLRAPITPLALDAEDELARRETLTLIRAFNRVKDPEKRERLVELVQALADADPDEGQAAG